MGSKSCKRVLNNFSNHSSKRETAPKTLEDSIFYGLSLDDEQKIFRDAIYVESKLVVVCNAKSGTGKTTISLGVANILYQYGFFKGIVYIASPSMEQRQGYLPGDQESKNAPYMEPLQEALITLGIDPASAIISDTNIQALKYGTAFIEFTVDTYLRGINFENKVIIIDEAQNFEFDDLKKTLTRIHDSCKTIIIGHDKQCDLKNRKKSGFVPYLNAFKKIEDDPRVAICTLSVNHRGWLSTFCDNVEFNI